MQAPVGVRAVKVAVGRDHLRLEPDAEFNAERVYTAHQLAKSALELILIDIPVSERGLAVIHNKHFDTEIGGILCDGDKLVCIEVEISRLPVVYDDRAFFGLPFAAAEIVAVQLMICTAHPAHAVIGIHHNDLRRLETFARLELPRKVHRIDAHKHAGGTHTVYLDLSRKVAGIHERKSEDLSAFLGIAVTRKSDEGIVIMARRTTAGMYPLKSEIKVARDESALLRPTTLKMEHIKIHFGEIDRSRMHTLN